MPLSDISTLTEKMQTRIDAMPCLKAKGIRWQLGNVNRGSRDFTDQCRGMSHGERLAATFIIHLWNWSDPVKGWEFNFGEAMNGLDQREIDVIREWMKNPWYA